MNKVLDTLIVITVLSLSTSLYAQGIALKDVDTKQSNADKSIVPALPKVRQPQLNTQQTPILPPSGVGQALPNSRSQQFTPQQQQQIMQMLQGQGGMPGGMPGGQQSLKDMLGPGDVDDIYGPIHIVSTWLIVAYVVGAIIVLVIVWLIIKYLTRPAPVIIRKFYEIAFEALHKVKASMNDVDSREFSIQISNVIRTYIEGRFTVVSTKSTTDEFMDMIRGEKQGALKDHMDQLHDFLEYCDLAKFAGCELTKEQVSGMMDSAWKFVDETKDDDTAELNCEDNVTGDSSVIEPEVVSKGGVV